METNSQSKALLEKMIQKQRNVSRIALLFAFLSFAAILYLASQLDKTNKNLEKTNKEKSELLEISLLQQDTIEQQLWQIDSLLLQQKKQLMDGDIETGVAFTNLFKERLGDSLRFEAGVYTYGYNKKTHIEIVNLLKGLNINIIDDQVLTSTPTWFSPYSNVFYYSSKNKTIAQKIAEKMEEVLGADVKSGRGAGFGVAKFKNDYSLRIHVRK